MKVDCTNVRACDNVQTMLGLLTMKGKLTQSESQLQHDNVLCVYIPQYAQGTVQVFSAFKPCICLSHGMVYLDKSYMDINHSFSRIYTPFHDKTDDTGTKLWQSFANAFILLGVIVALTVVLLLLYKYRCYKVSYALGCSVGYFAGQDKIANTPSKLLSYKDGLT